MRALIIAAAMALAGSMAIASAEEFRLTSPDVSEGGRMPAEQMANDSGCKGGNISPALNWSGAPLGTKSFAVTLFDPDTDYGIGRWHWIIYDIPASANGLPKNAGDPSGRAAPPGSIQGESDFETVGYGGPCPPRGDEEHRYIFKVYALDIEKLPAQRGSIALPLHLHFHSLAQATLTAVMSRPGRSYTP